MKNRTARILVCGLASVAMLVLPSWARSASAKPRMHVVRCKAGSTVAHPCRGTNGADRIFGTSGDDFIAGGNGNDVITGDAGDDHISGGNGKDHISGDDGNDDIDGGNGTDDLNGGPGDDSEHGGRGNDHIDCGDGSDDASDDGSDDTSANCEQSIQEYAGTVQSFDGTTITVQYSEADAAAQAWLDANGNPNPVTANVTPGTELKDGAPAVGDTVKLEAVPNSVDNTKLDAVEIEKEDESGHH